jgi:hypothetical protein
VVDAAADELLFGDVGRGRRTAAAELTDAQLTPNLLLVARDRAHASRRRGASVVGSWRYDAYESVVFERVCLIKFDKLALQGHQAPVRC